MQEEGGDIGLKMIASLPSSLYNIGSLSDDWGFLPGQNEMRVRLVMFQIARPEDA